VSGRDGAGREIQLCKQAVRLELAIPIALQLAGDSQLDHARSEARFLCGDNLRSAVFLPQKVHPLAIILDDQRDMATFN